MRPMPAIHVRDVPAEIVAALKERASRGGRSMQKEVLAILTQAAHEPLPPRKVAPLDIRTTKAGGRQSFDRNAIYADADD